MLELWIADLIANDLRFEIPSSIGMWVFKRSQKYNELLDEMKQGKCAHTFFAYNEAVGHTTSNNDFELSTNELIDICLLLSFITGKCVTPNASTQQSDIQFIQKGDKFIRPRAIYGFPILQIRKDLNAIFSIGANNLFSNFSSRRMELFLAHWISGLTCFTLEDMFLSISVQMDIIKQCEIKAAGRDLDYFSGMLEASKRFYITSLSNDYKNMRNDIVHEGKLSAVKFAGKSKSDCAQVIADTLNWIDEYVSKLANIDNEIVSFNRWRGIDLEHELPALSFHM